MSTPHWAAFSEEIDILDFWTQRSLDAYWKEIVKEAQEANFTGWTLEDDNDDTAPNM